AEESLDRTRHEPRRADSIAVGRALRILAATQRIGLATLALETAIGTPVSAEAAAAIGAFAGTLSDRIAELSQAVRESRRAPADGRLGLALSPVEATLDSSEPRQAFILHRMRAYVDALTRLGRLIGVSRSHPKDGA
ncbi:MAG: hypothetical protein WAK16_07610, partial [Candidatus Cybelea sp.]